MLIWIKILFTPKINKLHNDGFEILYDGDIPFSTSGNDEVAKLLIIVDLHDVIDRIFEWNWERKIKV